MSEKFQKGQLVAVSDTGTEGSWHLRVYSHTSQSGQHYCRNLELPNGPAGWWNHVVPAEEVWPGVFLFSDRLIIEACQEKDMAYVKTIENLCRRLVWLSEQLQAIGDRNGEQECPPSPYHDCRRGSCAECWEVASLKAVEEAGADGKRDS